MAVDRYTKLVLTVIAVCLVWLSLGGPSLITPVSAQAGDRVILAGWLDANGNVRVFPNPIGGRSFLPEHGRAPAEPLPTYSN